VREITEKFTEDYNLKHPHDSLADMTPIEFLNHRSQKIPTFAIGFRGTYITLCLSIFLVGCTMFKNEKEIIDLTKRDLVSIFDFVDSVSVIQLQINEKCVIAVMSKILFYSNRYYIFDSRQQKVLCFDVQGNFLFQVSQHGRGPSEYSYLEDIAIDSFNQQLMLLVPFGELLHFDLDGRFIYRETFPDIGGINNVFALNSDQLLFASSYDYNLLFYSRTQQKIVEELYPTKDTPHPLSAVDRLFAYKDSVYFSAFLGNEILNMSDKHRNVVFSWDFGKDNHSAKQIKKVKEFFQEKEKKQGYDKIINFGDFVGPNSFLRYHIMFCRISNRFTIAILEYARDYLLVFFDKEKKKNYVFNKTVEGISPFPFFMQEDLIFVYDWGALDSDINPYTKDIFSPEQLQIVEAHNPTTDNPFLVIYHLKK